MSKNKLSTESYKGVRDFYPEDQSFLNYFRDTCAAVAESFGYGEYHASVLEPAELYRAKGADNEELAQEQTYTFIDRGEREVTLRPEMTPTVARMVAGRRREMGFPLRLFSIPNVFRYERPQRGRLREHWQLNVDLFGSRSPLADTEIISVAYETLKAFGANDEDFEIRINSRNSLTTLIVDKNLSDDAAKNLLGLLDRRAKMPEADFVSALEALGISAEDLSFETPAEVADVLAGLASQGIPNAVYDASIIRGFNYYTGMVFEVFDTHPDNNRALFGGGRYDNLTALFDDEPMPGVGFGMGDVTLRDFLDVRGLTPAYTPATDLYIAATSPELAKQSETIAQELRRVGVNVEVDFGEKKLADQIKTAVKHKVPHLLVVGENELATDTYIVRNLESGEEKKCARADLAEFFI